MAYQVRWQLVGRSGQPLDSGCLGDGIGGYRDAVAAVVEVSHCPTESYWLARRSCEADLAVWVWIERHETEGQTGAGRAWMFSREAADQASIFVAG
jgi:hypothetical protein